jgi:hypothetical protein
MESGSAIAKRMDAFIFTPHNYIVQHQGYNLNKRMKAV